MRRRRTIAGFLTKSTDELVEAQYAYRADLRPTYDALVALPPEIGDCTVQTRKDASPRLVGMGGLLSAQPRWRSSS